MLRKCLTMFLVAALTASLSISASAANNQVAVSIPSFSVSLNELKFDNNDQAKYPLLVYRDKYDAIFQSSYNGWEHAMVTIYTLCQSKLTGSAKDVLETEQQQWLDMREQAALDTPIFLVTDMTKMRTYDLISFYFDDHFYD